MKDAQVKRNNYGAVSGVETSRLLEESLSTSLASEDIGSRTMDKMQRQREKLEAAKSNLSNIKDISFVANQNINVIRARVWRKKMYLWSVIGVLFVLNVVVLIRMLTNNGKIYAVHYNNRGY